MSKPIRIQRRRIKGWKKPDNAVVVTRPTRYGNPFQPFTVVTVPEWYLTRLDVLSVRTVKVCCGNISHTVNLFEIYATNRLWHYSDWLDELRGRDLCCWCSLGKQCHADVLLKLANN